ncbi:alpha-2-macroglobulin family protein [Paralcaligenes ureilyticus]|uniref:Alpha-2-macroglobulin n=1 Tax=Paralcaligenes ureilyticus TaxID=627131 RepID=A0A4R3LUA7_9BURK|nr:MG2 domain-containing protein [Paralcaligenes ureilyticus]TCT04061.1 hypothetical protein EDC26_11339 [Paralcaligenes ureilyticus]
MVGIRTLALGLFLSGTTVMAAQITQFSPQGEVARIESVNAMFDVPVVQFGAPRVAAPLDVTCNDASVKGAGRWVDARRWTYVFTNPPGAGVSCTAAVNPAFRAMDGKALTGKSRFSFTTGGPRISSSRPDGDHISEDQVFVLKFNGAVKADSLVGSASCLVEGLGEAVPVRLITGVDRHAILKVSYYPVPADDDASVQLLQCKRRLPADAKVQLKVGPGVQTLSGVASTSAEPLNYTVRAPFKATFSCQRENARAACNPVLPVSLVFNAGISYQDAQKVRLKTPSGERTPIEDKQPDRSGSVTEVRFNGPLPELAQMSLVLPADLKDDAGRALSNADQFPLSVSTAAFPPLVKFAAAPFGVIERFANQPTGGSEADYPASVPLTVRNVEAALASKELSVSTGKVSDYTPQDDADVLHWFARVARLQEGNWTPAQIKEIMANKKPDSNKGKTVDTREISMLGTVAAARKLTLPGAAKNDVRPFEVIGIPVDPGFHVLEIESPRLGESLVASQKPMYVRTSVLVTNLGVHLKRGRDDTLVWVTTLDDGKVVPDAAIAVLNCSGQLLATGKTDAQGLWHYPKAFSRYEECEDTGLSGIFVSARIPADHPLARHKADYAFVLSTWDQGIESWRFNVPTDNSPKRSVVAHTVFDRTLLRAGETVSMKHFVRDETRRGLELPTDIGTLPDTLVVMHEGSGEHYDQALTWHRTASGGLDAASRFAIPKTAKLGNYSVTLVRKASQAARSGDDGGQDASSSLYSGGFRVEEFKLPVLSGSLKIADAVGDAVLVAPKSLNADVQISYVSGGAAGQLPVSLSGVTRPKSVYFDGYDDYSFDPPRKEESSVDENGDGEQPSPADTQSLFLNKKALVLDAQGGGRVTVDTLPDFSRPQDLVFEASFPDPNGEIQTLSQTVPVWPAAILAGIRAGSWVTSGEATKIRAVALTPAGAPQANVAMSVKAVQTVRYSTRKRMVGGFYSYDSHTQSRDLGTVCQGQTNDKGLLECSVALKESGSIQLVASVADRQGHVSRAATTIWVYGTAQAWFGGANDDRIDVIPEKKTYKPGETAHFQVRMPFREATALVAVEREGVLATQVVTLSGVDPTVSVPIKPEWGPNVYVSVLALRGRVREVPWYSFFTWGWQQPQAWYDAYKGTGKDAYAAATQFVDLSKPAFRFGLAQIRVSDTEDQLVVKVTADKKTYQVRGKATVTVQVNTPDGKPAANGQVAFAAVDQALLELLPNNSWDLLNAMRQLRSYGVETSTAQMQIVGRRHYGRNALPAGGGGGKSPTRELLDTLLLWQPNVQLDQNGRAQITVPLNDSITQFKFVAVADYGAQRFGTGSTSVATTQDLQLISGLPALVRTDDTYQAMVTVRNTTSRAMKVEVSAGVSAVGMAGQSLAAQTLQVAAGAARVASWTVRAPNSDVEGSSTLKWTMQAHELADVGAVAAPASDRLSVTQTLVPSVPVTAMQATLLSVDARQPLTRLPVGVPKGALAGPDGHARGGLVITLQSSLAGGLPGVKQWFLNYPYTCLEQLSSVALGVRSVKRWQALMQGLPNYLDSDGLLMYFPGMRHGSEVLTAYVLAASNEAQALGLPFALPSAVQASMQRGLLAFVQGKIVRRYWSPQEDLDVRKLLALEALSRVGPVNARLLDSIAIKPNSWPTSAVIDWLALLQRVPSIPDRAARLAQATQILQARMLVRGTEMVFPDDTQNNWWWLMVGPDVNMARLILTTLGQPGWDEDMPRMVQGLLRAQVRGAWRTTTANLMGSLALEKFAQHYEKTPISGQTLLRLESDKQGQTINWSAIPVKAGIRSRQVFRPWRASSDTLLIEQNGAGQGWATVRSMAAVPLIKPLMAGYRITRTVTPVSQATPGVWSRGDVYRVKLDIVAEAATTWAVLTDPVPGGATILGSGLGRDSSISATTETADNEAWPSFIERGFDSYRAYYEYLPKGASSVQYTVRLNTVGQFKLPPTRIEAMYQPDVFGVAPNSAGVAVRADKQP